MKKILLGTTTLIGAASLLAGAAFAETPKVTVGGDADFQMGWHSDDLDQNQHSHAFLSKTTIKLRVDGKSDAGLGYGGGVDMNADTRGNNGVATQVNGLNNNGNGFDSSRTFIYVDGTWGRVEGGSDLGAQQTMKMDASNIARATGGIDGDWRYFTNIPTGGPTRGFWARPTLDLQYGTAFGTSLGNHTQENLNKITYYTPKFSGFQAGISYMVNATDRGQHITPGDTSGVSNLWTGGVSYAGKFSNVGVDLAVTAERGSADAAGTNDLRTWNAGGRLSYMGWSVAGSYGNIGDSLQTASTSHDDTDYWTAGLAYEQGPWGVSATWMKSSVEVAAGGSDDFDNLSLGADYKLAPGLTPYVEVSLIDMDGTGTGTTNDNEGTVGIIGTRLSF